jgi:hypothetical protein
MDKRPQRSAKNKIDLMPKNALCKRWDTPLLLDWLCFPAGVYKCDNLLSAYFITP